MPQSSQDPSLLERMRTEWDARARENARYYIATSNTGWGDEEFFETGRRNIAEEVLADTGNIFQGKDPAEMKVLEIGCGVGRLTRALAELFGDVYAVDVSGEMIAQGKMALADVPNAHLFQNNGTDLTVLGDMQVDFAFSYIVFQHIASREVIYNYAREVHRLLRPGGLFKFQVQGADFIPEGDASDTWFGVCFSETEAVDMANACGFEARYMVGAGTQYFWLWFFKR
jgi:ubiquinone/menaquinone biosynthesis C-methylase UbiE